MRRLDLKFLFGLVLITLLNSCYKEPFFNERSFMVGKWELVKIEISPFMLGGGTFPPIEKEILFNVVFEVEKKGIWLDYVDGDLKGRWRVVQSNLHKDPFNSNEDYIELFMTDYNILPYQEENELGYRFKINQTRDTLTSTSYPPTRLYPRPDLSSQDPRPVFTFVKIQ